MQVGGAFSWASPLGISVLLFLGYGALYLFVGVAAGFVISGALGPDVSGRALFNTPASDKAAFGLERDPAEILNSDPLLAGLRRLLLLVVSGLLTAAGSLVIAVVLVGRAPSICSGWHPTHAASPSPAHERRGAHRPRGDPRLARAADARIVPELAVSARVG